MIRMRYCLSVRASCEWNWNAYPSTSGGCGNCGGGKKAFDLKEATQLEDGQEKDDPCFTPQSVIRVMCACFVAKSANE